ncbi:MAG: hypothetical protein A2293_01195 [Elusimicrobia bacterium RIFOXYB2_FULL_49_7]|nr:MAG: hypothetical protein A2293_01195 [Elusimicrobia bacterium RIFOXYB2_FULL_49_7]
MIVDRNGHLRFEKRYNGILTALEGAELQVLLDNFFWHYSRILKKEKDIEKAIVLSVLKTYRKLYEIEFTEEDLKRLIDPDARKIDLFFRSIVELHRERAGSTKNAPKLKIFAMECISKLYDAIEIKPSYFGFGFDLKKFLHSD